MAATSQSKETVDLQIKLLDADMPMPCYQHEGDAGLDLPSRIDYVLGPGERAVVPTGIALAIPKGYAGFVVPRSGHASRHGISVVNTPGLVDAGYRGELKIIMINTDKHQPFHIKRGDRIAQIVIQRVEQVNLVAVTELDDTSRGSGGFGSTGTGRG
jgi:dUTP pyrophosphatase